jgi:hypothetical protein
VELPTIFCSTLEPRRASSRASAPQKDMLIQCLNMCEKVKPKFTL